MARLIFDPFHKVEEFTIILAHRDLTYYGMLHNVTDIRYKCNMNAADELSFVLHKKADGVDEELWDEVLDLRLVYVKDLDEYFECQVSIDDAAKDVTKTVTCTSLCEAELSQLQINEFYVNDLDEIDRFNELNPGSDYVTTKFYNPNDPAHSLLHRLTGYRKINEDNEEEFVYGYAPNYTIDEVDDSLKDLQRSFSVDGQDVYSFLTGECAEQFNCIFIFDSTKRTISAYDLYSVCTNPECDWLKEIDYAECRNPECDYFKANDMYYRQYMYMDECPICGATEESGYIENVPNHIPYRGEFNDKCPKCGDIHIKQFGKDTTILIDKDNFTEEINFTTDSDAIKNTFRIVGGDETITNLVNNINPNGSNKIYYFSEEQKRDMPEDLVERWEIYQDKIDSYREEYRNVILRYQNALDKLYFLEHSKMPTFHDDPTNAQIEYTKLINGFQANWPAVEHLSSSTNVATVTSVIKNYAKVFIKSGYFKVTTKDESYSNGVWTGKIIVTNYSKNDDVYPEGDIEYMTPVNINITDNVDAFIQHKYDMVIKQESDRKNNEENNIFDVLSIKLVDDQGEWIQDRIDNFTDAISKYSLVRLRSFYDALDAAYTTLAQMNIFDDNYADELYKYTTETYAEIRKKIGDPVLKMKEIVTAEINKIGEEIALVEAERDTMDVRIKEIRADLDVEENLGEEYYKVLLTYTRQQDYQNANFTADELSNNAAIYAYCRELVDQAQLDIVKSAEYQHSITANLNDLLVIPEFVPFLDDFEASNFIRVKTNEQLFRLRLLSYEIDFSKLQTINVEFSDMTKTALGMNDVSSILSAAHSMAGTYGYVQKQSKNGTKAQKVLSDFRQFGLDTALYNIKTNEHEEVSINNSGILLKNWNPETETAYDAQQVWITHNIIAFTEDDWNHTKMAMGKFRYVDETGTVQEGFGLNADFVVAGYIEGSTMTAGQIFSEDRNLKIDLNNNGNGLTIGSTNGTAVNQFELNGSFVLGNGAINYRSNNNTLSIGGGNGIVYNVGTGNITFGSDVSLSWNRISDKPSIVTTDDVGDIVDGKTQNFVKYPNLYDGVTRIDGGNISTGTITGANISLANSSTGYYFNAYSKNDITGKAGTLEWNMEHSQMSSDGSIKIKDNNGYDSGLPSNLTVEKDASNYTTVYNNGVILSRTYSTASDLSRLVSDELYLSRIFNNSNSLRYIRITNNDIVKGTYDNYSGSETTRSVAWKNESASFSSLSVDGYSVATQSWVQSYYLPKTGGSLSGPVGIDITNYSASNMALYAHTDTTPSDTNDNGEVYIRVANNSRSIELHANNNYGVYDRTNAGWLICSSGNTAKQARIPFAYTQTTNVTDNRYTVRIDSSGNIYRWTGGTSSRRYKNHITYFPDNKTMLAELLEDTRSLKPSIYRYNDNFVTDEAFDSGKYHLGLIVEDLDKAIGNYAVNYKDVDGEILPDSWEDRPVLIMTLALAQDNANRLDEKDKKIQELEDRLKALEALIMNNDK